MLSASQYTAARLNVVCPGPTGPQGQQGQQGASGVSGPTGATGPSTFVSYLVESASVGDKPIPVGANKLRATVVGGGGGGGGAYYDTISPTQARNGGGGGGSGLRCDFFISDIPADALYSVTVGPGGTAGANGTNTTGADGGVGSPTFFEIYSPSVTSYKYRFFADGGSGGKAAPSVNISGNGGGGFAGGGGGGAAELVSGGITNGKGGIGRMLDGSGGLSNDGGDGGGGGFANSGNNGSRGTYTCRYYKPQTTGTLIYAFGGAGGGPYGADSNGALITDGTVTNGPGILGGGGVGGGGYAPATDGGDGCVELYWSI
jgi:hypothetical protein